MISKLKATSLVVISYTVLSILLLQMASAYSNEYAPPSSNRGSIEASAEIAYQHQNLPATKKPAPISEVSTGEGVASSSSTVSVGAKTVKDISFRAIETIFTSMGSQVGAPWGLDRVDGNLDGTYNYTTRGVGVTIYVVDTGVDATHPDLSGRVTSGFDSFGDNLDQIDCNGHGTHVAALAWGAYFGVAKSVTIVPVRVLDCSGRGNTTTLALGIDWILRSHGGGLAIVNMSLGGNRNEEINLLTSKLVNAGLVVVAAAGNSGSDACNFSPGSAPGVITVGATNTDDSRASFSNWGDCVDVSAPGVRISSANSLNHSSPNQRSGTSQAAPLVAGAIATYISSGAVKTSNQVAARVSKLAINGVITTELSLAEAPEPSPAVVLDPPPGADSELDTRPAPEPTLENFVRVIQDEVGSGRATLEWSAVQESSGYKIYKTGSIRPGWRLFAATSSSATSRRVVDRPGEIAIYRVVALTGSGEIEIGIFEYFPQ
jgi:subtilisin family serine protease